MGVNSHNPRRPCAVIPKVRTSNSGTVWPNLHLARKTAAAARPKPDWFNLESV